MEGLIDSWALREIIRPFIDIALLAFLIYKAYNIMEETQAIQLLKGASLLALVYVAAWFLQLSTLLWILNLLAPGIFIGIAIVFQPELRSIFTRIGQRDFLRLQTRSRSLQMDSILGAAEVLSGQKRGALIVFSRNVGLKNIIDTGTKLNASLSSSLIITIFGHDTPLHDGALVIQNGGIVAAGCFLPLSRQADIRRSFGTRHRAALGLAEETDAVVLVVSEETGALSLAYDSHIFYALTLDEVRFRLRQLLNLRDEPGDETGGLSS